MILKRISTSSAYVCTVAKSVARTFAIQSIYSFTQNAQLFTKVEFTRLASAF